jgi:hypothetical protein
MTMLETIELRKVKGGNQTYKVLIDGKRPIIDVSRAVFVSASTVRLDAPSLSKLIEIERCLIQHISSEYTTVSSITVQHDVAMKKNTVVNVDSSAVHVDCGTVYNIQLKCRAVRYIENIAMICWFVDEATEDVRQILSFDEYDDESEDADCDDIEPPVDELLSLRMEALHKLDALMCIRTKLSSCPISEIAIHLKAINDVV